MDQIKKTIIEEYWLKKLSGELPVISLPLIHDGKKETTAKSQALQFQLKVPSELTIKLKTIAKNSDIGLFILFLSALNIGLHKYTGIEELLVGALPPAVDAEGGVEENILFCRNGVASYLTVKEVINQTKQELIDSINYSEFSLADILVQLKTNNNNPPGIFKVVLIDETKQRNIKFRALFDLVFALSESDKQIILTAEYPSSPDAGEMVERFSRNMIHLLGSMAENPGQKVALLNAVNHEEKQQLLYDFNDTAAVYPRDKTIHHLIKEQVERTPDRIAIIGSTVSDVEMLRATSLQKKKISLQPIIPTDLKQITYRQLNEQSNHLARLLIEKGIKSNNIVGIIVERSLEMIVGIIGILKSGGAYLPIDPQYPQERINYMLKDSAAKIMVGRAEKEGSAEDQKIGRMEKTVFIDTLEFSNFHAFDASKLTSSLPCFLASDSSNLAYVIYTSGSTGRPKGVMIEHYSIINTLWWRKKYYDFNSSDVVLQLPSFSFDSSVEDIFTPLISGSRLLLILLEQRFDTDYLKKFIKVWGVTHFLIVPSLYKTYLKEIHGCLTGLKSITIAGEYFTDELVKRHFKKLNRVRLCNEYGPTENSVCSTVYEFLPSETSILIGKPIANVSCFIMDKLGLLSPLGVAGELCVYGPGIARGYLNNPELTAERFKRNVFSHLSSVIGNNENYTNDNSSKFSNNQEPMTNDRLYKTGDLARWLKNGNIEFLGRIDHQVKIRGFRIELGEIESRLIKHPDIKEAVVLAQEEKGDKYLSAYIVLHNESAVSTLRNYLAKDLPEYMIPSYFVQLEKIPLTSNGKVDRKALPKPGPQACENYVAPRDEIEKKLVELWYEVLGGDALKLQSSIGIHDNFFHLGGHSLKATILVSKMHKIFDVRVPLVNLFKTPRIRELAEYIKAKRKELFISIESTEKKEYYALSPAQKRLYVLQQMTIDNINYNMPLIMPLEQSIDKERLELTFIALIARHESLRTSFEIVNEEPVQRIHKEIGFAIHNYNASMAEAGHIISNFARPFNLSEAPLLRVELLTLEFTRQILLIDMHHIITDGTSQFILKKEFMALYSGEELLPLRLQYKDYAEWQNSEQQKFLIKEQEKYWLEMFAEEVPVLNLPTDYPRPIMQNFDGANVQFVLTAKESGVLKELVTQTGATVYMCILSLFTILLSRLSGQEDIIVGTPIAARRHADLEKIIGMFVNTLPMRNAPRGEKSYIEFLLELKEYTLKTYENQEYQFEELVDKISVSRDTGRNPVFDVMFNLMNIQEYNDDIPGSQKEEHYPNRHRKGTSKFDLTLTAVELGESFLLTIEYCIRLFKPETIDRFICYFKRLLNSLSDDWNKKLSELEIITEGEKHRILYEFNDNETEYPKNKTIHQIFEELVDKTPDNIAVIGSSAAAIHELVLQVTYRELNEKSNRLVFSLQKKGIQPDSIVAIMVDRSIEMITGILGILKSGGAYLPIEPEYPQERIDFMLKDSNAAILLTDEKEINCQWAIVNGQLSMHMPYSFQELHHSSFIIQHSNLAYIIYTSGTTGQPKGALIEHRNVVRLMFNNKFQFDFNNRDVWTLFHSFCFDFSVWEMYGALLYGGKLLIVPKMIARDTAEFLKLLNREAVTVLNQTPSAFYNLINEVFPPYREPEERRLYLKYVIFGGEALVLLKLKNWLGKYPQTRLINMFGITETTVHVTYKEITHTEIKLSTSNIGKPIPTLSLYILDRYLNPVPPGVTGELCVGGKGVCRGYLNRPELTEGKFIENPFKKGDLLYRSGDVGRFLVNSDIEYLGRIDHQVKIRGFRIELGEIENRLLEYDGIKDAVVLAEEMDSDKYLCAYIVSCKGFTIVQLRTHLAGKLPDYMIPSYFVQLEKIPLTPNGKIDRKALPEPELKTSAGYITPRNDIEIKLVKLWAEILGRDTAHTSQLQTSIGIDDNFFQLGGHSLKATILVSKIHKEFDVKVPLAQIFKVPKIRELAKYIKEKNKELHIDIEPAEEKEYYELSPAQKRLYILQQLVADNTGYNMPIVVPLAENIEKEKLESVFKRLIERHESFRTSFITVNDIPVQRIQREVDFSIGSYSYEIGKETDIKSLIFDFTKPFRLETAPLLRVNLISLGASISSQVRRFLFIDMHHIINDGTSQGILEKEFWALLAGDALQPLRLRLQYKDYSEWYNHLLGREGNEISRQESYWLKEFSDEIPVLNLPVDYPRPSNQSLEGNAVRFSFNVEETSVLRRIIKKHELTLYMGILAIFNILLAKLSGQEDIIIGTPIAARRHSDLENVIGMLVNTLAMRNFPLGEKKLEEFFKELQMRTLDAYENQEYPFEVLVDKITVERDTSRNPVFDVMFNLLNQGDYKEDASKQYEQGPYIHIKRTSKFDMTLTAVGLEEKLLFTLEYSTCLFKPETIERIIGYYKNILNVLSHDTGLKIAEIEIMGEQEKEEVLRSSNGVELPYEGETIHGLFAKQASIMPDHIALVGADLRTCPVCLTYRQLNEQSDCLAHLLIEKGALPDSIVAIMMKRSIEMILGIFGALKSGGAYLPIDVNLPQERINYMFKDSSAKILLTNKSSFETWISKHETNSNDQKSNIQNKNFEGLVVLDFDHLNFTSACTHNFKFLTPNFNPANLAYVIYTSGSTGNPKGVMIDHAAVHNFIEGMMQCIDFKPGKRILALTTVSFDIFGLEVLLPICKGLEVVMAEEEHQRDIRLLKQLILRSGVDMLQSTPTRVQMLIVNENENSFLENLKEIMVGGEALPIKLNSDLAQLTKASIYNMYGPTETTIWSAVKKLSGTESITIGKPIINTQIYILNQYLKMQPVGIPGEIYIGGDGVARGYLNRPELTAEKFNQDLWKEQDKKVSSKKVPYLYKTGDCAKWLKDGDIEFLGRIDHQVKLRGFRIELGEIENLLLKHDRVKDAVVSAEEDNNGDKYLCAYIVSDKEHLISELREFLSKKLPDYMIPAYFVWLEKIPLTSNGKIDRKALPKPELKITPNYTGPRNAIERKLVNLWAKILGMDITRESELQKSIGIDDNFFQLGGHSLKATFLISKIHKELNVNVSLAQFFRTPNIRELAQYIQGLASEMFEEIEVAEELEYYPLSPTQKGIFLQQKKNMTTTAYNLPNILNLDFYINKERLEESFKKLIQRHNILRTSFEIINNEPVQKIHEDVEFAIQYYDKAKDGERREIIKTFVKPFALEAPPLLRVGLIRQKKDKYILLFDMHHIITDGISSEIFKTEVVALYGGEELPPLRIQYNDYSVWQNSKKIQGAIMKQKEFWLSTFAGEIPQLKLPLDFKRPAVKDFVGDHMYFIVNSKLTFQLSQLAAQTDTTLYMVLLAAYFILLYRYTNQETIVVGSPVTGRRHVELHNIIGMFVNMLAIKNRPTKNKYFRDFLQEVKKNVINCMENQDYHFEELVTALGLQGDISRNPLFDVVFSMQNFGEQNAVNLDKQDTVKPAKASDNYKFQISRFDLLVHAVPESEKIKLKIEYSTRLFRHSTIEAISRHYLEILEQVSNSLSIKLDDIKLSYGLAAIKSNDIHEEGNFGF